MNTLHRYFSQFTYIVVEAIRMIIIIMIGIVVTTDCMFPNTVVM